MKNHREETRKAASIFATPLRLIRGSDSSSARKGRRSLPEGWRQLPTGWRGARLYYVTPPADGGGAYWQAEVTLKRERLSRRFASELHARAWLADLIQPHRKFVVEAK